ELSVESDSETPRICLKFSRPLQRQGDVRYEDYIRFEPKISGEFIARGQRLCVEGAAHGTIYEVTTLKGLPGSGEYKTEETEQFTVSVPDRKPSLTFSGATYILPRAGRRELPLQSVNVEKAALKVLRINDRNLIGEINQGRVSRLISKHDARQIASQSGELIWQGSVDIAMQRNRQVKTALPIGEILKDPKPGIYVVTGTIPGTQRPRGYRHNQATQWVVVSDIGISTYRGAEGLHVFVRSLESARPLGGMTLRLVARNNSVLDSVKTDRDGRARFAPGLVRGSGGSRPAAVMAAGNGGDFNFHDLTRPAFDLTDRGVGGRAAPGPIDAYLYTDRGVYRPGATVHITALARDDKANALENPPLVLKVFRPDGTEHRRFRLADGDQAGGHTLALALSAAARTGRWTVRAYADPKAGPVGTAGFLVEDFAPERMEVALTPLEKFSTPAVENAVDVKARFLYGAPASGLRVEGEMVLQQDMNPYPRHKGYKFGLVQETWRPKRAPLKTVKTDEQGKAQLALRLPGKPQTTRPLRAVVRASVAEAGGRAVSRTVSLPVRSMPFTIGIKPRFGERWVGQGNEAGFDVIALDRDGAATTVDGLTYELFGEEHRYRWYYLGSRWNYKVLLNETSLKSGSVSARENKPASLAFNLKWGRYRLEVHDRKTGAATSVRFQVGWFSSPQSANIPDKLEIALDKEGYRPGDRAKVHIRPPFAGQVLLTVVGSRLYTAKSFEIPEEGKTVELPVGRDWDAGTYVTATIFRPANKQKAHEPARAVGVAWLGRDFSDRILAVEIDTPEKIKPRQTIEAGISVRGIPPGQPAFVTLAAVDEGVLQLTRFKTPSPDRHYFGKRRLAVELRDDYGRLIKGVGAPVGRLRQGGDAAAAGRHLGGLEASSIKIVALFSGRVRLDKAGRARIPLAIPDFNGRLRLMAVAYGKGKVGHADAPLIVRDALVSQLTLPRFLAPGDKGGMTLSLRNVDGAPGAYRVKLAATGAAAVAGIANSNVELGRDARKIIRYSLDGKQVGVAKVALTIEGPQGFAIARAWDIAVRPAQTAVTRNVATRLAPGESATFKDDLLTDFVPGTGSVLASFSKHPDFNVAGLLKSLDRYPYGCAEQTTSRALPLLYLSELAEAIGLAENKIEIRARVQKAIGRVLAMQRSDGSFGMWSSRGKRADWLSAYVMDFLTQAKKKRYLVPEFAYKRGLQWLAGSVSGARFQKSHLPANAYAFYVLAQANAAQLSAVRYFHDVYLNDVPTALGRAQIGAALATFGDEKRAVSAFAAAPEASSIRRVRFGRYRYYWDYGSALRDAAAITYLASLTGSYAKELPKLVSALRDIKNDRHYLSTQEKAWLVLVTAALQSGDPMQLTLDGRDTGSRTKPFYLAPSDGQLAKGVSVGNRGDQALWQNVTVSGVPVEEMESEERGFVITRSFYTLDGDPVDLDEVRQSDVLVAVINGEATNRLNHQALIVDLLPAGFEIENERLTGGRKNKEMAWLPKLARPRHTEKRDDRYVAALDLRRRKGAFSLAYVVRAVTPGTFRLPAVFVEDMYKTRYFARGEMSTVTVVPRQ
ncbi:MAG: alpha-2-macroglobulin family protein, partial [Alphaproteobacteria bacterium]|nr:alpha-2-macroglobulin family protein [Alphaproteobacteria bacterium]